MAKKKAKKAKTNLNLFPKKGKRKEARLKRQAKRQQNIFKKPLQSFKQEIQQPKRSTLYEQITDTLNYIQNDKHKNSNQKLSKWLELAIKNEIGDFNYQFSNKDDNNFFTIDTNWDGNINTLINNVKINKPFQNPKAIDYLDAIVNSEWGNPKLYADYIDESRNEAYKKNTEDIGINVPDYMIDVLRELMNSSEMWHIVGDQYGLGTVSYDSEQAKSAWDDLHRNVQKLMNSKSLNARGVKRLIDKVNHYDEWSTLTGDDYKTLTDEVNKLLSNYRR